MGWKGKFIGGLLGGLPGTFIGDIIEGSPKESSSDRLTSLMAACSNGERKRAKFLIFSGADVNACCKDELTPLLCASTYNDPITVKLLIERGARVNASAKSEYALHNAAERGFIDIVKLLLSNGAVVNPLFRGYTPLELASRNGHTNVVELLKEHNGKVGGKYEVVSNERQIEESDEKIIIPKDDSNNLLLREESLRKVPNFHLNEMYSSVYGFTIAVDTTLKKVAISRTNQENEEEVITISCQKILRCFIPIHSFFVPVKLRIETKDNPSLGYELQFIRYPEKNSIIYETPEYEKAVYLNGVINSLL